MIERINGRVAALIAVVAVLLVLLVGWFAFVSPQRSKAASLNDQINSLDTQIASTQAYLRSSQAKNAKRDLVRLKRVMPENVQMSQILRQLSAAAQQAGVSIEGLTPGGLVPSAGGQALPIAVTVQGHYFRLSNFLHILRSKASVKGSSVRGPGRLYSVDGISFSGGGQGASLISASISLDAFISTPAPPPPPTTTTTTTSS